MHCRFAVGEVVKTKNRTGHLEKQDSGYVRKTRKQGRIRAVDASFYLGQRNPRKEQPEHRYNVMQVVLIYFGSIRKHFLF